MRLQNPSHSRGKSKSAVGCCIAKAYRFTEFVELFAAFYDADQFFGRAAKDRDP
jgi:hypothetical protein